MLALNIPVLGLSVLSLLVFYKFIIYPAFISPLSKVPTAHWSSPFSPLWILWTRYTNYENRSVHAAHLKHGPVVRLGPNELSVNDLGGLRTVYAGGFEKGQWYSIFDNYGVPCMFSSWHSRPHSARKRMISNIYSKSNLQSSPAFARQAQVILYDRLLPAITSKSKSKSENSRDGFDIMDVFNATTMDFITAYLFGLKNGSNFLQNESYRRHWMSLYHSRKTYTFFPQELPYLTKFFKTLGVYLNPSWVDDANQELEDWCQERCDATSAYLTSASNSDTDAGNEPVVMNAILSGIKKEEKSKGQDSVLNAETLRYPELSIASEMIDHLAAGHETAGITLTYIAWHLSQDIPLQGALRKELLTLDTNMDLSHQASTKQIPNSKELDGLPLLHAIIMETLRLDAAIPGNQPRMTPYPSCTLGPYIIPEGVRVGAQAHSVHRNEAVYPEPEKWDYKRWMDSENGYTEDQKRERDRWFWAFSSGGRMCIGSNFAMLEIKLVIAAIYSNFTTHIVNDDGIEQEDGYTVGPASNQLILRFERVAA
ncbi:cytochrome P450 monooxygenase-like protein [Halenospora varia]|nr:cytochrome P450 monooxygenase-like protein [Halenospora varia]